MAVRRMEAEAYLMYHRFISSHPSLFCPYSYPSEKLARAYSGAYVPGQEGRTPGGRELFEKNRQFEASHAEDHRIKARY